MGTTSDASLTADSRKFENLVNSSIASHVAAAAAAAAAAAGTFNVSQPQTGPSEWYNRHYIDYKINDTLSVIGKHHKCFRYTWKYNWFI